MTDPLDRPKPLRAARLRPADVVRLGGTGLRTRPLRVFLSALGIAIGVAAMVAVVGISGSGQAEVDRRLDALGTNLLRVAPANPSRVRRPNCRTRLSRWSGASRPWSR